MCLFFRSFSTWHGRPGVYVQDICVEQRFRGGKVGEALLQRVAALTRAKGGDLHAACRRRRQFRRPCAFTRGSGSRIRDDRAASTPLYGDAFQALADGDADGIWRNGMKAFYADEQKRHDPKAFLSSGAPQPNPEKPERVERLLAGARAGGLRRSCGRRTIGLGPIAAIHTSEYLDFLEHIFVRWQRIEGASAEVIPNIHPIARGGSYPASAVGQAGYHMADTACPISAETLESACWSAWSAVEAADAVLAGEPAAYALCRPPGHHAFADVAGGFCFLNNSAIAAQRLRTNAARVAILDVDLHHGNGTQGIFYARPTC